MRYSYTSVLGANMIYHQGSPKGTPGMTVSGEECWNVEYGHHNVNCHVVIYTRSIL